MDARKYPPDEAMLVLAGLVVGSEVAVHEGELRLNISNANRRCHVPVSNPSLDELESRGWVEVAGDTFAVTETGRYHCDAWMTRKLGKGRVVNILRGRTDAKDDAEQDHQERRRQAVPGRRGFLSDIGLPAGGPGGRPVTGRRE